MEWMWNAAWAWFGWYVVAPIAALVAGLIALVAAGLVHGWRHRNCQHTNFYETRSCDAVCSACGENLGFIGNVRKQRHAVEQ